MTGMDERLAKVAEVLGEHQRTLDGPGSCRCGAWPPPTHDCLWPEHLAQALAPLLGEWQAEDEARALRPIRALADEWADACYSPGTHTKCRKHALRRALAAAEPDAGARQ